MTIGEINTKLSQLTNTDTNSYPAAERLIDFNMAFQKVVTMIIDSQGEGDWDDLAHGDYAEGNIPMVAGQRDYTLAQNEYILFLKKVSITYDGTNYYEATPIDSGEMNFATGPAGSAQETTVDAYFSKNAPVYDYKNGSLFVYPRADATEVANGASIHLEWTREPSPFTSGEVTTGTRVPGFDSAFHPLLAYLPAWDWCIAKGKTTQADRYAQVVQDLETRLRRQYSKKVQDRRMNLMPAYKNMK